MLRAYHIVLVLSFCALICVPSLSMLIWPGTHHLLRAREVAYPPVEASTQWMAAFEQYFAANFGQKRRLVQLHNGLGYALLGDVRSKGVLAGRSGWLFLKKSPGWESFRSEVPLSTKERDSWTRSLQTIKRRLARKNIPFLFVTVPSKETIYPEFLPQSATRARPLTRLDEMVSVLRDAGIEYLDIREPLLAAKREQLYDKLDSHWNGRGAQVAAKLILERVGALLEKPPAYAELQARFEPRPSDADLRSMLALDDYLVEESIALLPTQPRALRLEPPASVVNPLYPEAKRMLFEVSDPSLPKALILRDSFATALMEPMAEKFRRSLWVWTRELDLRALEKERPDIVIIEIAERFFSAKPPRLKLPRKL